MTEYIRVFNTTPRQALPCDEYGTVSEADEARVSALIKMGRVSYIFKRSEWAPSVPWEEN